MASFFATEKKYPHLIRMTVSLATREKRRELHLRKISRDNNALDTSFIPLKSASCLELQTAQSAAPSKEDVCVRLEIRKPSWTKREPSMRWPRLLQIFTKATVISTKGEVLHTLTGAFWPWSRAMEETVTTVD